MSRKAWLIVLFSLAATGLLYFVEQSAGFSYIAKTVLKIALFVVLPLLYIRLTTGKRFLNIINFKSLSKREMLTGLGIGICSFAIVMAAFWILKAHIDLPSIANELETKLGITPLNFIFVGLYIIIVNSFVEEFFFRGILFFSLKNSAHISVAYLFSSLLFAVYHMAIFQTWFSPLISLLCLFGLFSIGIIFNYLNSRTGRFFNSWLAHALADCAIILIGLSMFGII